MKVIQLFEGEKWKDSVSQWFKAVAGLTRKEDGPVSGIWPSGQLDDELGVQKRDAG